MMGIIKWLFGQVDAPPSKHNVLSPAFLEEPLKPETIFMDELWIEHGEARPVNIDTIWFR